MPTSRSKKGEKADKADRLVCGHISVSTENAYQMPNLFDLSEEDLEDQDLVPVVGDRVDVHKLLVNVKEVKSSSCLYNA